MRFQVPQFIDVEDKILGPITAKSFAWLLGGVFLCAPFYFIADLSLFLFVSFIIMGIAGVFGFYKPYGKSFSSYFLSIIQFFVQPRLFLWKKTERKKETAAKDKEKVLPEKTPDFAVMAEERHKSISVDRLAVLASKLDTLSDQPQAQQPEQKISVVKSQEKEADKKVKLSSTRTLKNTESVKQEVKKEEPPQTPRKKVEAPDVPYGFTSAPKFSPDVKKKKPAMSSGPKITYDEKEII